MSSKKRRKQRLHKDDPKCSYCNVETILGGSSKNPKQATIDHLDTRYSPYRGTFKGEERTVLCCRKCNHDRGAEEEKNVPIGILRERSKH